VALTLVVGKWWRTQPLVDAFTGTYHCVIFWQFWAFGTSTKIARMGISPWVEPRKWHRATQFRESRLHHIVKLSWTVGVEGLDSGPKPGCFRVSCTPVSGGQLVGIGDNCHACERAQSIGQSTEWKRRQVASTVKRRPDIPATSRHGTRPVSREPLGNKALATPLEASSSFLVLKDYFEKVERRHKLEGKGGLKRI
jgi:hypothetical protein